jgi:hypothetical protein
MVAMAKKVTSTILRVYLLDKSAPGKEGGIIKLCDDEGKVTQTEVHFDALDDVPEKIRALLDAAGVTWPRPGVSPPVPRIAPRDEWERKLLAVATDCGVSLPDSALSSEGLYE